MTLVRAAGPTATRRVRRALWLMLTVALLLVQGAESRSVVRAGAPAPPRRSSPVVELLSRRVGLGGRPIIVGGLGSSVGAAATLPTAADAPVAYFARRAQRQVLDGSFVSWKTVNGSVPGSTIHDGLTRDWAILARHHPDIVVLAYGMNDGMPAQFDMGETYGGAMNDLRALLRAIQQSGAAPLVLTSPSAHTTRVDWNYPEGPRVPQSSPVDTVKAVRLVQLADGRVAPESTRHAAVDQGMREVARELGVDLIDVEPYWLRAVAGHGEDALFNPDQFVHPDLLGHTLSYRAAIDHWLMTHARPDLQGVALDE